MSRLLLLVVMICQSSELGSRRACAQASTDQPVAEEKSADSEPAEPRNPFAPPEPILIVNMFFSDGFRGRLEGFDGEYVNFRDLDSSKNSRVHLYDMQARTLYELLMIAERERMAVPPSFRILDDFWNYSIDGQVVIGRHYETKESGEVGIVVFSTIRDGRIREKKPPELTWYKESDFQDKEDRMHLEEAGYRNVKTRGMFMKPSQLIDRRPQTVSTEPLSPKGTESAYLFECMNCHVKFNGQKKRCPECGVVFGYIEDEFGNRKRLDTGAPWRSLLFFIVFMVTSIVSWIKNKEKA